MPMYNSCLMVWPAHLNESLPIVIPRCSLTRLASDQLVALKKDQRTNSKSRPLNRSHLRLVALKRVSLFKPKFFETPVARID